MRHPLEQRWHLHVRLPNGINGGNYNTKTNIANVLAAGTAENTSFNADLDRIAQFVQPLKTAGGVAILRLFHEAGNGCSWFWWSWGPQHSGRVSSNTRSTI